MRSRGIKKKANLLGHWSATNAYGQGSTLPPINYRTDDRRACNSAFGGEQGDQEALEHSWYNWDITVGFKSRHPGGANFLFGDGSIHFLPEDIDHVLYQYMGAREDGRHIEEIP